MYYYFACHCYGYYIITDFFHRFNFFHLIQDAFLFIPIQIQIQTIDKISMMCRNRVFSLARLSRPPFVCGFFLSCVFKARHTSLLLWIFYALRCNFCIQWKWVSVFPRLMCVNYLVKCKIIISFRFEWKEWKRNGITKVNL